MLGDLRKFYEGSNIHLLVERGGYGERPEEAFLRDRPFQLCVFGFALTAIGSLYMVR